MSPEEAAARGAGRLYNPERLFDFLQLAHAGGENDSPTKTRNLAQIRKVGDLTRWNFPEVHAERLQAVNRNEVERCRHESYSHLTAHPGKPGVSVKFKVYLAAHIQLALTFSGGLLLIFRFWSDC